MVFSLWDVAHIFMAVTLAAQPVTPSASFEPVTINSSISSSLFSSSFSSDPTQKPPTHEGSPIIEAFLINSSSCLDTGDTFTYRVLIHNTGTTLAKNLQISVSYPETSDAISFGEGATNDENLRLISWDVDGLSPNRTLSTFLTLHATEQAPLPFTSFLTVSYSGESLSTPKHTLSQHSISRDCGLLDISQSRPGFFSSLLALAPNISRDFLNPSFPIAQAQTPSTSPIKSVQPVIICDPAETNCTPSYPKLGDTFQEVTSAPALVPIVCSVNDPRGCTPNKPELGDRFAEAYADILPGECRVLEDDIITTPEYQDALSRQAQAAAPFMKPLYDSGQDFRTLVHENVLLGIGQTIETRTKLLNIYEDSWQQHAQIVRGVINKTSSGANAKNSLTSLLQQWTQEIQSSQADFKNSYTELQEARKQKFDPIEALAIENAKSSIALACKTDSDGGISQLLPPVQTQYESNLDERLAQYTLTQQRYINLFAVNSLWQNTLFPALDAFDNGNPQPLNDYLIAYGGVDTAIFAQDFNFYMEHASIDEQTDNDLRINQWEVALDTPKTVATTCEKEIDFNSPVETTTCESVTYPEFIITGAPEPVKASLNQILPPDTSSLANNSVIDPNLVKGGQCQ